MRTIISTLLFAAAVGTMTLTNFPGTAQEKTNDDKNPALLEGSYTIVSGEKDGRPIPDTEIQGSIVRFTGDKIVGTDKEKKEFFVTSFTLDAGKTPWVINMKSSTPKEATATGLVKKEGDTVTIIYALPGGDAPQEFKTREKQQLFVLKNLNKDMPNKFTKE